MATSPSATGDADVGLRWVRFEGIYYAAMTMPASDAPVEVPAGSEFVVFLDGESGAVVDAADVQPFDPSDREKAENPAAVAGVEIAKTILYGSQAQGGAPGGDDDDDMDAGSFGSPGSYDLHRDGDDDDAAGVDLLTALSRTAEKESKAERKERRAREKEERRERKRQEKEERKQTKSKRTRERDSDDDDDDDDEDALLLGKAAKKGGVKKEKRFSDDDSDSDDDASEAASSSEGDSDSGDDDDGDDGPRRRDKAQSEADRWAGFAQDFGFGDDDEEGGGGGGARRRAGGRSRAAGGGLSNAFGSLRVDPTSAVSYFLPQIKHAYLTIWQEAVAAGKVVSAYEADAVRAVEQKLRAAQGHVMVLERALRAPNLSKEEKQSLNAALKKAEREADVDVEKIVRGAVVVREPTVPNRGERPERAKRPHRGGVTSFQDPTTTLALSDAASFAQARDMTTDVVAKYREQVIRRKEFMDSYRATIAAASATQQPQQSQQQLLGTLDAGSIGGVAASSQLSSRPTFLELWRRSSAAGSAADGAPSTQLDGSADGAAAAANSQQPLLFGGPVTRGSSSGGAGLLSGSGAASQGLSDFGLLSQPSRNGLPATARRPVTAADGLNLYNGATAAMRQSATAPLVPAYYNYDAFLLSATGGRHGASSAGTGGLLDTQDGETGDGDAMGAVTVSPMAAPIDHPSVFALASEDHRHGGAGEASIRSSMASASHFTVSHDSVWNSMATSVVPSESVADGRRGGEANRGNKNDNTNGGDKGRADTRDWRRCAKRVIQEQLTMYVHGHRGRPQVLPRSEFSAVGRLLLDRAMHEHAKSQGCSMALRGNNESSRFTREMEAGIRKSVENYVRRRYVDGAGLAARGEEEEAEEALRVRQERESARGAAAVHDDVEYRT